ncbi:hypothetical protein diail_8325 [Diaporthe ilicicola]|nr:hypothetical protein diail_8325 [Diaporthe ilicicola]
MKLTLAVLAAFAGAALADMHSSCACNNGGFNWRITSPACDAYGNGVSYDTASGHCISEDGDALDGDQWQAHCQTVATEGFACADGKGTCYASTENVRGSCN